MRRIALVLRGVVQLIETQENGRLLVHVYGGSRLFNELGRFLPVRHVGHVSGRSITARQGCFMIICPLGFELQRFVYRAAHLRPTIVKNEHGTLENTNLFCRFLLKCGVKGGEKPLRARVQDENSSRISNLRRYGESRGDSGQYRPGPLNLRMRSIRVVEGIGVWVFRQTSCYVSVHASTLPEWYRPRLQTPG